VIPARRKESFFSANCRLSHFRVNGVDCYCDSGTPSGNDKGVRKSRICIEEADGRIACVTQEDPFPGRSVEHACISLVRKHCAPVQDEMPLFSRTEVASASDGGKTLSSRRLEEFMEVRYGMTVEWVSPERGQADEKTARDLTSLLGFLMAKARVDGVREILDHCDAIGESAGFVRKKAARHGIAAAYPFSGSVVFPNASVLTEVSSVPENMPGRFLFLPEKDFQAMSDCRVREETLERIFPCAERKVRVAVG